MRPETGYSYQCLHFETNCLLYVQCVQPPSELELWSDCRRVISSRIIYPDSVIDGCHAINTLTKLSPSLAPNNRLHTRWVTRDGPPAMFRANIVSSCLKPSQMPPVCVRLLFVTEDYTVFWLDEWGAAFLGCHHTGKKVFWVTCTSIYCRLDNSRFQVVYYGASYPLVNRSK